MSTPNQSDPQNDYLNRLSKITHDIVKESATCDYIYRGEPEHYEEKYNKKVSSTLYRLAPEGVDSGQFNLKCAQEEILEEARNYIHEPEKEDFEILTELQHHGSETNLIDFTTDYYIALFFACDGSHDKDGRVILLPKTEEMKTKYRVKQPQNPRNRVMAQKSIFVQPPKGFIDPDDIITIPIPATLKQWILIHLRKFQDISTQTIYNDLHGFIKHRNLRTSHEALFPLVVANIIMENMTESQTAEERQNQIQEAIELYTTRIQYSPYDVTTYMSQGKCYEEIGKFDLAIETFSKAILLRPDYANVYYNRGMAYDTKGDYDFAIEDFTKAIELNSDYANAYYNRGIAYLKKEEVDLAIEDFDKFIDLHPNYAEAYHYRGLAYDTKGDYDFAIEDFTKAIELNPDEAIFYYSRGVARLHLKEWQNARADLTTAKDKGMDVIALFQKFCVSVASFEQRNGLKLPVDIAEMLTPPSA